MLLSNISTAIRTRDLRCVYAYWQLWLLKKEFSAIPQNCNSQCNIEAALTAKAVLNQSGKCNVGMSFQFNFSQGRLGSTEGGVQRMSLSCLRDPDLFVLQVHSRGSLNCAIYLCQEEWDSRWMDGCALQQKFRLNGILAPPTLWFYKRHWNINAISTACSSSLLQSLSIVAYGTVVILLG